MSRRSAFLLVLITALTACATTRVVDIGREEIAGVYSVDSPIPWSRFVDKGMHIWTVDGPSLAAIYFISKIDEEEPLRPTTAEDRPEYRADMTLLELQEFLVDSLTRLGYFQLHIDNSDVADFGGHQGLRLDFDFLYQDGLEGRGLLVAAILEERLYVILYSGVREHYFPRYRDAVEHIISSISLK